MKTLYLFLNMRNLPQPQLIFNETLPRCHYSQNKKMDYWFLLLSCQWIVTLSTHGATWIWVNITISETMYTFRAHNPIALENISRNSTWHIFNQSNIPKYLYLSIPRIILNSCTCQLYDNMFAYVSFGLYFDYSFTCMFYSYIKYR